MDVQPCSRCGSDEVVPDAEVRDYDASSYRPLSVVVPLASPSRRPDQEDLRERRAPGARLRSLRRGRALHPNADALLAAHRGGGS